MNTNGKKRFYNVITLLLLLSVIMLSIFGDKGILQLKQLKKIETSLKRDIRQLKQEELEWQEKVSSLKTNKMYLESLAREELGMIRRDEIFIQFENADGSP
jgi:cell division protein FtsB